VRARPYSIHVWYEDLAIVGRCAIGYGYYLFTVRNRFTGEILDSWDVVAGHPEWSGCVRNWREYVAKFIKRLEAGSTVTGEPRAEFDPGFSKKYPAIAEHLSTDMLDGRSRLTTTLLLSTELGKWKACIRDRDNDLVAWVTADTLDMLLIAVEGRLAGKTDPDWRVDKFAVKGGKRK